MQKIQRSALVMYSAEQMFKLVDDVEQYPDFVPNCDQVEVIARSDNQLSARLGVSKSGVTKSFATQNTNTPYSKIDMQLLDGPFKSFHGQWIFTELAENASKIELSLEFEFSNKLASIAFKGVFNHLAQSMVAAFTERAKIVYG